jgi:putative transposase
MITARLHRKSPSSGDVLHLDEIVVRIGGTKCWLWRAVDQDGYVLDEIQTIAGPFAGETGLGAARRQVMPAVQPRSHKGLDNRAENSHLPFRKRERTRQGFRSIGSLQQFVSIFSAVRNHFVSAKSNRPAAQIRSFRQAATTQRRMAALQLASTLWLPCTGTSNNVTVPGSDLVLSELNTKKSPPGRGRNRRACWEPSD